MSSFEVLYLSLLDMPDPRRDFVDQIMIVSDQQQCARVPLQRDVESIDRFKIQMIGGFVQDEKVWFLQHEFAEDQPCRLATGQCFSSLQRILAAEQHLAQQAAQFLL